MTLRRLPGPFSDPDWLFEINHDGFRSLAYVQDNAVDLVSRRRYVYKSFAFLRESIARDIRARNAVLDGEIVCLDERGHTQFNTLMRRRGDARFYAFDLLWLNGEDLRTLPLGRHYYVKPFQQVRPACCTLTTSRGAERICSV
jgi:bifunctional non-homologous end joining protein LigD